MPLLSSPLLLLLLSLRWNRDRSTGQRYQTKPTQEKVENEE